MSKRITLQDIAEDLGISRTTVHRALQGKEGIGEELRATILERALELGYTTNYIASSLKRKTIHLAAVLPRPDGDGQLYHRHVWDAIREHHGEAESLNVAIDYHSFDEEDDSQIHRLQQLFDGVYGEIDGLLTMPATSNAAISRLVERFSDRGIPVVLIDNDLPDSGRLCCVAPHDRMTGRLGAEILTAMLPAPGTILVAAGSPDNESHRHNLEGFQNVLSEQNPRWSILLAGGYGDAVECYQQALRHLQTRPDIVAFYSVTARNTLPLCQAVTEAGLAGTLRGVGSDLFPQSAELLQQDVLQALIYKNAYDKGHLGFRILFDHVVKQIPPQQERPTVPISVIMKNNLCFFQEHAANLSEQESLFESKDRGAFLQGNPRKADDLSLCRSISIGQKEISNPL